MFSLRFGFRLFPQWAWLPAILCAFLVSLLIYRGLRITGGNVSYPLDDTYIAAAIAKNLAAHGVWGVTRYESTGASSTPFFTLVLAGVYRFAGPADWWPLVLSGISAICAVLMVSFVLRSRSYCLGIATSSAVVVLVPLPVLGVLGMEHALHVALFVALLHFGIRDVLSNRFSLITWCLGILAVGTRLETLACLAVLAILAVLRRSFWAALCLALAAIIPVAAYGWFLSSQGGAWLPNSILLKSRGIPNEGLAILLAPLARLWTMFGKGPHMLWLVVAMTAVYWQTRSKGFWLRERLFLFCALVATVAHLELADLGWVYRYEGYLIAAGLTGMALNFTYDRDRWANLTLVLTAILVASLAARAYHAYDELPQSGANVYSQQVQMARFLTAYHPKASVAANDIGAINFYNDLQSLDLVGLSSNRVYFAKRSNSFSTAFVGAEATRLGVTMAIVYDDWFGPESTSVFGAKASLPADWVRVCQWRYLGENLVLGSPVVSFYSVKGQSPELLREQLVSFPLPPSTQLTCPTGGK